MIHRFCIAPMMDRTDRHERYFLRTLSKEMLLYTEMIHANAVIHGNKDNLLKYHASEHPLAIQLGGSNADDLLEASLIAEGKGFDEINLNVGCPSPRVQSGSFGAVLMKQPCLVRDCLKLLVENTNIPVTVKCRIGVDKMDEDKDLDNFVTTVKDSGCKTFIIHARKAWLKGLSPKDNREIPPLNYERVYRLKDSFPDLEIIINGGIETTNDALEHLKFVDGVMVGRSAYDNPYPLVNVDKEIYSRSKLIPTRAEVLEGLVPYMENEIKNGNKLGYLTKHLMGLFKNTKHAKKARYTLANIDDDIYPMEKLKLLINETKELC